MHKDIDIEEALGLENARFVDLRSPGEYTVDTIPGAFNLPLLNDEERKIVGTIYNEQGPYQAREAGLGIVAPKLPDLVRQLERIKIHHDLIIFCWRGGLRSKSVAQLLDLMGIFAYRLKGGYKAYRRHINTFFNEVQLQQIFVVLDGLTGTGKTEIVHRLEQEDWPVLDLEGLANHRGSVFGSIGLGEQPSQRRLESQIFVKLISFESRKIIVVEGESRRIGRLFIPEVVYRSMEAGKKVLVYSPMEVRVKRLVDDYAHGSQEQISAIFNSLSYLQRRLGKRKVIELQRLLNDGQLEEVAEKLLREYYDVLYQHPEGPEAGYDLCVNSEDVEAAVRQIEAYLCKLI
ncbi:MAG TPA: tRNA 2-selenouridine(34) synthase MnmH [Clostridia bacterium]|nr:tRNA 2-selenouridine(34) synthase MnmH [Clostridia bacterium]